jgi:sodium/bile acid cotransporter 7
MIRRALSLFEPFILTLIGTVVVASLLPPRGAFVPLFDAAADAGIVLLFFLHGAKLSREAIVAGMRNWRLHLAVFAATYVMFPLLGLAITALPLLDASIMAGLLFLTLLPSTVQSSIAFTAMARGNVAAAVCSASFSNLIGIFLTPALVALLMSGSGGMAAISLSSVEKIMVQLLLPFVAGHLLRPLIGAWVTRHKLLVTFVDRGSILLVVYTAFGAAVVAGLWSKVSAADLALLTVICCVLLAIVLTATWGAARALRFPREDAVVLLFCGSKKSLASGVPIAGVLFAPEQIGMIILPVMLFHQIQLIACALIARRMEQATLTP